MKKVWALVVPSKGIIDFVDIEETRDGLDRLERMSVLFENPFTCKDITDNKKVKLNSTFDPATSSFSEDDSEREITGKYHVALIQDNVVKTVIKVWTEKRYNLWKNAELEGVIAVDVTDMEYSQLKVGMLWDGTSFSE